MLIISYLSTDSCHYHQITDFDFTEPYSSELFIHGLQLIKFIHTKETSLFVNYVNKQLQNSQISKNEGLRRKEFIDTYGLKKTSVFKILFQNNLFYLQVFDKLIAITRYIFLLHTLHIIFSQSRSSPITLMLSHESASFCEPDSYECQQDRN